MHLVADDVCAERKEDDAPFMVGFYDRTADYCLFLSRFSDLDPDEGMIDVMVRDQIWAPTADLAVYLGRSRCRVVLDEATAADLLGVREYVVDFQADDRTYAEMVEVLRVIFQGLSGPMIEDSSVK